MINHLLLTSDLKVTFPTEGFIKVTLTTIFPYPYLDYRFYPLVSGTGVTVIMIGAFCIIASAIGVAALKEV